MNDVPRGEVGEIVYRGPTVMTGYWNKPEATAEAFAGGWFHSGDLVREDEDGYIYVVDRKKDMIISGGENIYCAEVEDVLAAHPKVAEVALIGVPHERWGETPLAVVAPRDPADPPTPEELVGLVPGAAGPYKKPARVSIVDALPRNASGKVLKTELRAGARRRLTDALIGRLARAVSARQRLSLTRGGQAGPDLGDLGEHRGGLPCGRPPPKASASAGVEHVLADRPPCCRGPARRRRPAPPSR